MKQIENNTLFENYMHDYCDIPSHQLEIPLAPFGSSHLETRIPSKAEVA